MSTSPNKTVWGHINVNVADLEASIAFYELLGFSIFSQGIAYLGLSRQQIAPIDAEAAVALDVKPGTSARACIMQLGSGFPKLDLTELADSKTGRIQRNDDAGLVRMCLGTADLAGLYVNLTEQGADFLSEPATCRDGMAEIAVCRDPDGTLIELIQIYPDRWPT